MTTPLHGLTERIRHELIELDQVVARFLEAWHRARRYGDDFYLDIELLAFLDFLDAQR